MWYPEPMLTQQQRNNKRQRASPRQLAFLRKMFKENPRPDQQTRESIGRRIDMTPRSVQIWFQNNRAKLKYMERTTHSENLSTITTHCGDHITRVQLENTDLLSLPGSPISASRFKAFNEDAAKHFGGQDSSFACDTLSIGEWQRVLVPGRRKDLWIYLRDSLGLLSYVVMHETSFYRIDVALANIKTVNVMRNVSTEHGGAMVIHIYAPTELQYFMRPMESNNWERCNDFTDGQSAYGNVHEIRGSWSQLQHYKAQIVNAKQFHDGYSAGQSIPTKPTLLVQTQSLGDFFSNGGDLGSATPIETDAYDRSDSDDLYTALITPNASNSHFDNYLLSSHDVSAPPSAAASAANLLDREYSVSPLSTLHTPPLSASSDKSPLCEDLDWLSRIIQTQPFSEVDPTFGIDDLDIPQTINTIDLMAPNTGTLRGSKSYSVLQ